MADVFISYSREDRLQAEHIARGLATMGLEVFWDTDIPPGQTWADYVEGKLAACSAVIVLWSQHSAKSQWVREEARMGRDRNRLIPAKLDATPPPLGFGEVQAADLSTWRGEANHPDWTRFAQAVYNVARGPGAAPAPPPASQPQAAWSANKQSASSGWQSGASTGAGAEALSPVGYVMKCLRLYFSGGGRARRSELGWFTLFVLVVSFAMAFLDVFLFGWNGYASQPVDGYALMIIANLALIAPTIAALSRRAHDVGMTGWIAAAAIIPYVGFLAVLVFIFIPGQPGANQYGPNPKGV